MDARNRFKLRAVALIAMASSLAMIASGCAVDSEAADEGLEVVTITYPHYATSVPAVALVEIGKKHGLDIRELPISSGADAITALTTGQSQASILTTAYVYQSKSKGIDFGFLTNNVLGGTRILTHPDLGIDENDFDALGVLAQQRAAAGKKLKIIASTASINWALGYSSLVKNGIDVDALLDVEDVVDYSLHPQMLEQGVADLMVTGEPYAAQAVLNGSGALLTYPYDTNLGSSNTEWVANKEWVEENPDTAKALVSALEETLRFLADNPDETVQLIEDFTGLDGEVAREALSSIEFSPCLDQEAAKAAASYLYENGLVEDDFSNDVAMFFFPEVSLEC